MKWVVAITLAGAVLILTYGPLSGERPGVGQHYGAPEPILPMTFAHQDHQTVQCVDCHHNYIDDTGNENCMSCHVSNAEVWPLFETQFHDLCRGCHVEQALAMEDSGPTRDCIGCHRQDPLP